MDFSQDIANFESMRGALASLQRLLFCCQCCQLTKNVCSLGNCEHIFCKQCVEEQLGASCPVCDTPAHARDAQVNRQLSNIVSLSLELGRLLQTQSQMNGKGGNQEDLRSTPTTMVSPLPGFSPQNNTSSPQNRSSVAHCQEKSRENSTRPSRCQEKSGENATRPSRCQTASPALSSGRKEKHGTHLPQKMAFRKGKRESPQTTLTQLFDEHLSDEANERHLDETLKEASREKVVRNGRSLPQTPPPQTRLRNRRRQGTPSSKEKLDIRRPDPDQSMLTQFLAEDETTAPAMDVSSEDGSSVQASPQQRDERTPQTRGRLRGRQRQKENMNSVSDGMDNRMSSSSGSFKTPSQSPSSSQNRSGSFCSNKNESNIPISSLKTTPKDTPTDSLKATPRRRSAPPQLNQITPHRNHPTSRSKRKSLPSSATPALTQRTRRSPLFNTSPAKKSTNRKARGRNSGNIKRNAKGETALHVAAIKGDLSAVKELLDRGDNPNVRDNAGWTPLHEAVNHGYAAVAEVLLQHGAMVNMPGLDNETPLHDAAANNRLDCVRLLTAYGASSIARNIHGKTALELANTAEVRAALQEPALQQHHVRDLPEPEDAEEFMPLCFLGTALSRDQRGLLQKCATKLHANVVEEYCAEVTHVVSSVNADGQCPRTLKYLCGILGGKWIVSVDWVAICLEYGEKVSEEPFEIAGSSTHPNSNAAHQAHINRILQLPALFDGCQMYLHGSFTRLPPNKQELAELLRLGGARLLTREPRLSNLDEYDTTVPYHASPGGSLVDCGIFIVHDGETNIPSVEAQRMRTVPASWVIECIATFSLVEPSRF